MPRDDDRDSPDLRHTRASSGGSGLLAIIGITIVGLVVLALAGGVGAWLFRAQPPARMPDDDARAAAAAAAMTGAPERTSMDGVMPYRFGQGAR
jgi:hypothetical protein